MNSEKWEQAKRLYEAALGCPPGERARFLDENCGDDDEVRREVESLLSFSEKAGSFLEEAAIGEVAADILAEKEKFPSGQRLSHYEIIEQIGAGGMGEVYLALDKRLGRRVALKFLPPDFASDKNRARRFKQEARAASALNHPNIIVIHEIGEAENETLFIATEYIEGETLRGRLNGGGLSLPETLDIAVQLAGALAAAHQSGIIHRDIKPENIMLRPDGYVKVLDFGLAKLLENRLQNSADSSALTGQNTAPGLIMGTARYMSPEQTRGQETDERTDIFSFGIVLYETIAGGRVPFDGESNADVIAAILDREPPPLTELAPDTPVELQRIVRRALQKNTGERYQSMRDMLADLKDVRDELQIQTKLHKSTDDQTPMPPTGIAATNRTQNQNVESNEATAAITASDAESAGAKSKNRKLLLTAALVLLSVILSGAGVWFFGFRQNAPVNMSLQKATQLTIWSGLDDYPSMSPDGSAVAFCSNHNGSFEIYVKPLTPGAKEIQLTSDGQQNFEPAFSPDGKHIAYYSKLRGGVWVIPATGGEARQLTDFGSHPAWSPDGRQIIFQSNPIVDLGAFARNALPPSTLWIVPFAGGEPRQLSRAGNPPGGHGSPAFSPDGRRIVFEANTFNISSIWSVAFGGDDYKPVSVVNNLQQPGGYAPVYVPGAQSIFYQAGGVFHVGIDPETGEIVGAPKQITGITQPPSTIRRVSFSADGRKIAYNVLTRAESISSVSLRAKTGEAEGAPAAIVSNTTGRINFPSFSPDGKRITFSSCATGGALCDIWVANADGSGQLQLTTSESNELMPDWFPDGENIAYISNRTGKRNYWAINLNTKRERQLLELETDLEYARLSPDGKKLVFHSEKNGVINIWNVSLDGGEPRQLTFDQELMGFPAWSPDGKSIAFQMKRGDDTHIIVMPSDGGTPEQLTFDKGQSWIYGWSPDGDKILFAGFRDGFWNVRWVSRSTKKQQQLTDNKKLNSFVRYPSWSPLGNQIIYEYSETTGNIWVADLK